MDCKSLLGQSRLEPSPESKEKIGLPLQEDVTALSRLRDKLSPSPVQDTPESSLILKDTPSTPTKERCVVASSLDIKDENSVLAKPSQDEVLMEVVEKSEEPSNQVLSHVTGSNFESSEIEERPAVSLTLDQNQSQASLEAEVSAVAWSGPHFSPEHKELSTPLPGRRVMDHL